jgi:hypothetical protein
VQSFLYEAMKDTTLIILAVCAVVSLGVGLGTEGVEAGWYDGAGIVFAIVLVVLVTGSFPFTPHVLGSECSTGPRFVPIHTPCTWQ